MVKDVLRDIEAEMKKSIEALKGDLMIIRTGRASPMLLQKVMVDYYGVATPLIQMASVAAPEPRLLVVKPWDPQTLSLIEKAILKSDLNLTPSNDGKVIRLPIPELTEERRNELVKMVHKRVEEARVSVRNARRDGLKDLKELEDEKLISEDDHYRGKDDAQELTDKYIAEIDDIGKAKEEEILER